MIAHRGASRRWPEHSRPAYVQALAEGADGLECDVRLTSDGIAVCWHDATVDRTSDGHGPVHERTLAQLRRLDLLRGLHPPSGGSWDGPAVLTLAELVELAQGAGRPVTLAIELKHPVLYGWDAEDAVLEVLDRAGWRPGAPSPLTISLMSFHPGSLLRLHRSVPAEHLMPLIDVGAELVAQAVALADASAVGGVGPSLRFLRENPDRVERWLEQGATVRVWTVDEPADLARCVAAGVTEVTTNVPARILSALADDPGSAPGR